MAKRIQRAAPRPTGAAPTPAAGPAPSTSAPKRSGRRVSTQTITDFTLQLATLTESGIPIVKALTILEGQTRPGPFKDVLAALVEDVSSGTPLSEAMAKHPNAFDRLYASMVKAGEAGGVLDRVLVRHALYLEKSAENRSKVVQAMIYPAIIVFVAIGVVSAVNVVVIPKFQDIFRSFKIDLPAMTQVLLDVSAFVVGYWWLVFGLPIVLFVVHLVLMRSNYAYRYRMHGLLLKIPLLGDLLARAQVAAFARTFGTLIQAGVPHLDALGIVRDATRNEVLAAAVADVRNTVREGEGLARPMGESGLFDDLVVNMVDVGEATGELDKMLLKVADAYDTQVDRRLTALFKVVEPALIIFVAAFVGFIIVALFLPLLEIMNQVGRS